MKHYKELNLTHSKSKVRWWFIFAIFGIVFVFTSCEKENNCDNVYEENGNDEYYVKYEVNSSTIYTGGKLDVIINTENNETMPIIINKRVLWETVIGPVKKGFNATLKVSSPTETHNKLKLYTKIYVSKNNSPFALKKNNGSDVPRDFVQINYTIDY